MDKRKEANFLVKEKITAALFSLLETKKIDDISVTDLITTAGVARASFYRNFDSILDILQQSSNRLSEAFAQNNPVQHSNFRDYFSDYDYLLYVFQFYLGIKDHILCAYHAGVSTLFQAIMDYHIEYGGDMPANSIERYELYYYSGAIYSVVQQWILSGVKESPEDMARQFIAMVNRSES